MNIDKAIEIKSCTGEEFLHTDPDDIDEADRLAVEALKRCKYLAEHTERWSGVLLPGETKE